MKKVLSLILLSLLTGNFLSFAGRAEQWSDYVEKVACTRSTTVGGGATVTTTISVTADVQGEVQYAHYLFAKKDCPRGVGTCSGAGQTKYVKELKLCP
jgi:hypothetical protein